MMIDYNALHTALMVAERGGFTRASEALGLPPSTVSARVQALESALGAKLFHRSTRRVQLTEAGRTFFEHARRGNEAFEEAVTAATRLAQSPRGVIRVVAPALFARHLLPQVLPPFLAKYPDLSLTVEVANALPDLVEHRADLGIGVGPSRWAAYTRRTLFWVSQGVYASPRFIARWGSPAKPDELQGQPVLSLATEPAGPSWLLASGSRRRELKVQPRVSVADVSTLHSLALAGIGAALLPQRLCEESVAQGTLVRLLPDWSTHTVPVSAYFLGRKLAPEKVIVFLDFLIEWFARQKSQLE
jgi:DNA-binding transcriptional LysR family regulator